MSLTTSLTAVLTILRTDPRSLASRALAIRRAFPFGQFGQANDARTNNGATGCTDTCLQFLALLLLRRWHTHDQIRGAARNLTPLKGLSYPQVDYWLREIAKLPYKVQTGLSADTILGYVRNRGPVLVGEIYPDHPEWQGYRYFGVTANGRRNGYSWPRRASGKTQLGSSYFRHAIVFIAVAPIPAWGGQLGVYVMEPNHGSPARPEKVAYDVITITQARVLVNRYAATSGKSYAAFPVRQLS